MSATATVGWFDVLKPTITKTPPTAFSVIVYHTVIAGLVLLIITTMCTLLINTVHTPEIPAGYIDYDAVKGERESLSAFMKEKGLPEDSTPMRSLAIATASFGGIYTEERGSLNPWIGTVSPDAARLQVEAGARALILDIWPDPADRTKPVVCAMVDTQSQGRWWATNGLSEGVGRYSNWQLLTRNKKPVGEIVNAAITAAFQTQPSRQNEDPFFLVLKLHGAMTTEYLNQLGDTVRTAIGGRAMSTEWNKFMNQKALCKEPVSSFKKKVFLIVIPDIQPGYFSLPSINAYAGFTAAFMDTRLGEITNALEQQSNTIFFEPSGSIAVSAAGQPNCSNPAGPQQSLAQVGLCVIQPTIGGDSTDNMVLYADNASYTGCLHSGAQMVGVNLFPPKGSQDSVLNTFFNKEYFGKYSFRPIG